MSAIETRVRVSWDAEVPPGKDYLEVWQELGRKGWLTVARGQPRLIGDDGAEILPSAGTRLNAGEYLEGGEYIESDGEKSIDVYAVLDSEQLALVDAARSSGYVIDAVRSGIQGVDTERESSFRRDLRAIAWLARKDGCSPTVLGALLGMQPRGAQAWLAQRQEDGFEVLREPDKDDLRKVRLRIPKASVRRVLALY